MRAVGDAEREAEGVGDMRGRRNDGARVGWRGGRRKAGGFIDGRERKGSDGQKRARGRRAWLARAVDGWLGKNAKGGGGDGGGGEVVQTRTAQRPNAVDSQPELPCHGQLLSARGQQRPSPLVRARWAPHANSSTPSARRLPALARQIKHHCVP